MERDAKSYLEEKTQTEQRIKNLETRNLDLAAEAKAGMQALEGRVREAEANLRERDIQLREA